MFNFDVKSVLKVHTLDKVLQKNGDSHHLSNRFYTIELTQPKIIAHLLKLINQYIN